MEIEIKKETLMKNSYDLNNNTRANKGSDQQKSDYKERETELSKCVAQ